MFSGELAAILIVFPIVLSGEASHPRLRGNGESQKVYVEVRWHIAIRKSCRTVLRRHTLNFVLQVVELQGNQVC